MSVDTAAILDFLERVCRQSEHPTARFWQDYWIKEGKIHRLIQMIERVEPLLAHKPALLDIGGFGELLLILWKFWGLTTLRGVSLEGNCIGYRDGTLLPGDDPSSEFTIYIDQCDVERERLKFQDSTFDLVSCFEMLEHLRHDPFFMILEIHRVLRPEGLLLLTTPNSSSWESLARIAEFAAPFAFSSYFADGSGIGHCKEFSVNELRQFIENAGFRIEEFETFDSIPFTPELTQRHRGLLRYLESQDWWKPELRRVSQLVLARKTSAPKMRMYRPLYTEDFNYVEQERHAGDGPALASDITKAVENLEDKLLYYAYITRLQDEIESRTRWALSLEKTEKEHRDELARLSAEFDARSQWALSLDQEVRSLTSRTASLLEEVRELQARLVVREEQFLSPRYLARQLARLIKDRIIGRRH